MGIRFPDKLKNCLKGIMKKDKLILILLAGILLVIINIPVKKASSGLQNNEEVLTPSYSSCNVEDYVSVLEEKLEKILSRTAGVGENRVCIVAYNSGKSIVHTKVNTSDSITEETDGNGGSRRSGEKTREEDVVFTQENGRSTPFIEEELAPEIQGVIIIAQGAGDMSVVSDITQAASALLGISVNKIKVLKMEV